MSDVGETNRRALRVLHVVRTLAGDEVTRIVIDLLRQGANLAQHVAVLCLERPGHLASQAQRVGARVLCAHKPAGFTPRLSGRVVTLLHEFAPDVVHSHQIRALFYVGRAARRADVPFIMHTEHGVNVERQMHTRLLGRLAARNAHRVFAANQDIASAVVDCGVAPERKVSVIPDGIDPSQYARRDQRDAMRRSLDIPRDATVIGAISRLNAAHRLDLLIRAFAVARQSDPRLRLVLVGDGARATDLQTLAEQLNLNAVVHFVGYHPQPQRYLQIMDAFAMPSRSHCMPPVVLEAWAAGLAVIAARAGGISQPIEHQYNGLLFESGDERGLASAIATLSRDRSLIARLGDAGRKTVSTEFHIRTTAQTYHEQYLKAISIERGSVCQVRR